MFVLGLISILGNFFVNLSLPDSSYNFLGKTREVKLDPGKPVTQLFTAENNYLNQVKIIIGNLHLLPGEKIVFELADVYCENAVAHDTYQFFNLAPHIYYRFNFRKIPDSQGEIYCLQVTYLSPFDRDSDKRPFIEATRDEEEPFRGWSYYDEGNQKIYENRTLKIRPAYGTGSFWSDLAMLNNRLSQYKPGLIKGLILPLLSIFILGCCFLVSWIIHSKDR